jgi:hypothetical protein
MSSRLALPDQGYVAAGEGIDLRCKQEEPIESVSQSPGMNSNKPARMEPGRAPYHSPAYPTSNGATSWTV